MRFNRIQILFGSRATDFRLSHLTRLCLMLLATFATGSTRNSLTILAAGPPSCVTVSASGPVWQNIAFVSNQTGTFTAEMDATPLGGAIDAGVGLSNGAQNVFPLSFNQE